MSEILQYKCPACGGKMEFEPGLQKLKCPYCDTVRNISEFSGNDVTSDTQPDASSLPEDVFEWSNARTSDWTDAETQNMQVFTCQSCGGEVVGDCNTAATQCPYCGNNVVFTGRFQGSLKPDYVIPFQLDINAAKEKYRQFIKNKTLLPALFKDENHIDEIKGIYVPFWLFDSTVSAYARFRGENVRCWSDSRYQYTETTVYDIFRQGKMAFRNIPVDGSSKMPDDLMESIEPFDFSKAVPFKTAYMAGYFADKYDVDERTSQPRANERLRVSAQDILRGTVHGYGTVIPLDFGSVGDILEGLSDTGEYRDAFAGAERAGSGVSVKEGKVKYALYPVYLLSSTYKGQKYTFAMNGQTGRFVGDLPMDKAKRNRIFFAVFAAASALFTLLSALLG